MFGLLKQTMTKYDDNKFAKKVKELAHRKYPIFRFIASNTKQADVDTDVTKCITGEKVYLIDVH